MGCVLPHQLEKRVMLSMSVPWWSFIVGRAIISMQR